MKNAEHKTLNSEPAATFPRRRSSFSITRSAFTLTEILVVVGLIVLLMVIAVPAFNLITGSRSVEGATNQLSAAMGRARMIAIGLQKTTGVMFFIEPRSQRLNMAIVEDVSATNAPTNASASNVDVWLDIVDGTDFLPLPAGVTLQTMCDATLAPATNTRLSDGYLGFNTQCLDASGTTRNDVNVTGSPTPAVRYGGVILFDGSGQLVSKRYGFRCWVGVSNVSTKLGQLLQPTFNAVDFGIGGKDMVPGSSVIELRSQFGLVMFETDPFTTAGGTPTDSRIDGTLYGSETREESWLDENATPYLINRYNGTLVKGQ